LFHIIISVEGLAARPSDLVCKSDIGGIVDTGDNTLRARCKQRRAALGKQRQRKDSLVPTAAHSDAEGRIVVEENMMDKYLSDLKWE